jgi:hypothetical protein
MGFLDARYIKRRASWPVWSDSTTTPIRFQPMPKKAAVRLWHRTRTSIAGRASLVATAVLHALGLLNFATGWLDPSYAAIARKANVCEHTGATALARTTETRNPSLGLALYRELARRALRAGCWQEPRIPSDSRHLLEFRQVLLRRGKQMFGLPGCMSGSPPAGRCRPKPLSRSGPQGALGTLATPANDRLQTSY